MSPLEQHQLFSFICFKALSERFPCIKYLRTLGSFIPKENKWSSYWFIEINDMHESSTCVPLPALVIQCAHSLHPPAFHLLSWLVNHFVSTYFLTNVMESIQWKWPYFSIVLAKKRRVGARKRSGVVLSKMWEAEECFSEKEAEDPWQRKDAPEFLEKAGRVGI